MLEAIKDKLRNLPVDYAEIHVETNDNTIISHSKTNVEQLSSAKVTSGNVRVLVNGGWGFVSFNESDFESQIEKAIRNAKLVGGESFVLTPAPEAVCDKVVTKFEVDPASWTLKDKNELVLKYNALLQGEGIVNTRSTYKDSRVVKYYANTAGSAVEQHKTFCGVSLFAMAKDGTNVQQAFESTGGYGGIEIAQGLEETAGILKKRALDLLKAPKVEAGQYRVLLNPKLTGVFAHEAFGHLSEADFLYESPRRKDVMVLGRRFGPDELNIIDDGSLEGLAGFTPYDDEGVPARKNYLVKDGKLVGRLHSRETASKMGEALSGNARAITPLYQPIVRMTNTYIEEGSESFEALLAKLGDGIYACDALGGMTNDEMFTFSSGYAFRVKDGKIGGMIRDVVLSGNVFKTLLNIEGIGGDRQMYGGLGGCGKGGQFPLPVSDGGPHLLVKDVVVGGV